MVDYTASPSITTTAAQTRAFKLTMTITGGVVQSEIYGDIGLQVICNSVRYPTANKINFVAGVSNVNYDFSGGTGGNTCEVTSPSNLVGILCTGDFFASQCDFTFSQAQISAISPALTVSVMTGWVSYASDRTKLSLSIPLFCHSYYGFVEQTFDISSIFSAYVAND